MLAEYQKAPQVTRDRMYLDSMQQIYSNVTKVMVDSKQGSNLLYLPLDKILQMSGQSSAGGETPASGSAAPLGAASPVSTPDARNRDVSRSRERDSR